MTPIRILVAEPDPSSARALHQTLEQAGMQVLQVKDTRAVHTALLNNEIDLVLLASQLRDDNGVNMCRRLRSEGKLHPIILLSKRNEDRDPIAGIEQGADDYLYLPFHPGELLARIHAVLRRSRKVWNPPPPRQEIRFGNITVDLERIRVTRGDELIETTPTEFRLLRYLLEHRNQTCERDALMEYLRGSQSIEITPRTIDVHMRRLRQKLEDEPANPRWLVTVHGIGYRFSE